MTLFSSSVTQGQRWLETVILTQQGPMTYTPTVQHSPQGYFTADVFPVDITNDNQTPGRSVAWPTETNTFDVPVFSGVRVKQPTLTISKVMPYANSLKRKKISSKKNADYIKQLQQETPPKMNKVAKTKSKSVLELPLDPRTNEEIKGKYVYPYRGRRFVNRGHQVKQSEKILKGQAIDYTKSHESENYDPQIRYNVQEPENPASEPTRAIHFIQNGDQGLAYGYVAYPQFNVNQEDGAVYYRNNLWR